jgi:aminomethyltransferase
MSTSLSKVSALSRTVTRSLVKRSFAAPAASEELVKTALYDMHKELGGDMVAFAGYELPVLFKGENGGVMKEHLWCREEGKSSLFDVSHMGQVRIIRGGDKVQAGAFQTGALRQRVRLA